MNVFTRDELKNLMEYEGPCVSIFMPTLRASVQFQQNPVCFKNMLKEAEDRLVSAGMSPPEARELLAPAQKLLLDDPFWRYSNGIALFLSPDTFRYYRLPFDFEEHLVVADRFNVKPLLRLQSSHKRFYILALSQNKVRLFEGENHAINEIIGIEGVPRNLAEALKHDDVEKQLQTHRGSPGISTFHSHPAAGDARVNIRRYFQRIDRGLRALFRDRGAPLLLAGVSHLLSIYREANSYPYLLQEGIEGNPDRLEAGEMYERAWSIVRPYFFRAQQEAVDVYKQSAGTGLASDDVNEIVPAAYYGRVETLFINTGAHLWGKYGPDAGEVELETGAVYGKVDLLATVHTILNGGVVYTVQPEDMPVNVPMAAVYRYR